MASTKKMDVPDIGGLLGQIAEKRNDLPKAPIQSVQPIEEKPAERKAVQTAKRENIQTGKKTLTDERPATGRPSVKQEGIEYIKISPRIPKPISKAARQALLDERFKDAEGRPVKTLDELVAFALEKLLRKPS